MGSSGLPQRDLEPTGGAPFNNLFADNTTEKHGGHHYTWAETELDPAAAVRVAVARLMGLVESLGQGWLKRQQRKARAASPST